MSLIRKLQSQKSGQKNDFVFMSIIKNIWWFFLNPFTIIIWKRYTGRCDYVTCWLIHEQHWEQKLVSINIKNKKIILRISNCKFIVKWTINWQFINLCYKCFSSQCMTIKCIKKKKRRRSFFLPKYHHQHCVTKCNRQRSPNFSIKSENSASLLKYFNLI